MDQHHHHHQHPHPHLPHQPATAASATSAGPPLPPPHPLSQPHSQAQDQTEDPQVLFKTAANALAQLYRRSITPDRRAHSRGYASALNDVNASLDSLPDHPLSVQSNGRTFVPLDLVKHLVAALGVQASEHHAMLEEHDHPLLMPTLSPMMPGLMAVSAPVSASALGGPSTAGPPSAASVHQHQQYPSGLTASVSSSAPAGSGIASAAAGGSSSSSVASGSTQQGSSSAAQQPASKAPMFPWMLDGEPTRKRPRDF